MFDRNGGRKYLNESERSAYLRAIKTASEASERAFLLTLFYTGCRISEGLNLQCGQVDLAAGALVFETLKRRRRGCFRALPVPDALVDLLRGLVTGKEAQAKLWEFSRTTGYRLVKAKMTEAGVVGGMACPKGLRHGHAVACVTNKIPLTTIQKWLGHARVETTAIYLDLDGVGERQLAAQLWAEG